MGHSKWADLVVVSVLFHLLTVVAQQGFLSIDCGGTTNYTAENNISWVADTNYIDVGERVDIGNDVSYLHSLRHFPKPHNKSCYHLPVIPNMPYLLRLWFAVGNYTGSQNLLNFSFAFSIETAGMLAAQNMAAFKHEKVLVSSGTVLYICLIRTSESNDPFISAIELRTLRNGMYQHAKPGTMLSLISRVDAGAKSSMIRYPQDEFDRLWEVTAPPKGALPLSMEERISTNNTQDIPPSVVMQTAWITNFPYSLDFSLDAGPFDKLLLLLYFANKGPLNMTIHVFTNSGTNSSITMVPNYSAVERAFLLKDIKSNSTVRLSNNLTGSIVNAFETYSSFDTEPPTYSKDFEALDSLKVKFRIRNWISDPCFLIPWKGIGCDNISSSSSAVRVSEINLSEMKLTGSLPENIGDLTALVNLSFDANNLNGSLPNLSRSMMLKRLHLQNNNFTGTVPDWLCGLQNLQELFIDNNNFSGVIPACLFKPSLNFSYTGNPYLQLPSIPGKDRLRLILSITLSGSLVIGLVLIVIIVVRRKQFRTKEGSRVENESKLLVDEDNTVIMVPNTTNFRAFTLEEITESTQNFSQTIGRGGFGSVFFGKLQQRMDIAVKVLSIYSNQGVHEFLNEVDLLSKVHHKNLVPLLGYCNESRELMLVYQYMWGGSLRDHLYGPFAEFSQLSWKIRLNIALDAAQGLEYLHVGCIPKIIHRDIKTANILLDKNFKGKLSDFGLSRMTIDGEVSHVTASVKGTLGYLDPEYFRTQMLTEKSDVYSFGVVLLEIICGREPINPKLPGNELNIVRWVTPYVEMDEIPGKIDEIVDKRMGRNYDVKSITRVAKLAIRCVQPVRSSRPTVIEVVEELKETLKLEQDNDSLVSEIDVEYEDLSASQASLYLDSSGPKEMDSAESSSKVPTAPRDEWYTVWNRNASQV